MSLILNLYELLFVALDWNQSDAIIKMLISETKVIGLESRTAYLCLISL